MARKDEGLFDEECRQKREEVIRFSGYLKQKTHWFRKRVCAG